MEDRVFGDLPEESGKEFLKEMGITSLEGGNEISPESLVNMPAGESVDSVSGVQPVTGRGRRRDRRSRVDAEISTPFVGFSNYVEFRDRCLDDMADYRKCNHNCGFKIPDVLYYYLTVHLAIERKSLRALLVEKLVESLKDFDFQANSEFAEEIRKHCEFDAEFKRRFRK